MLTIDEILKTASRDLDVDYIPYKELKSARDTWLDGALNGYGSPESYLVKQLRYLELCCKAYGDKSVAPPASSVPSFVARQHSGSVIHLSSRDVARLSQLLRLVVGWKVNPNDLLRGMKHGPGATADGLTSVDKWLSVANGLDPFSGHIDPLKRLPRVLGSEVCKYFDVPKTAWSMRGICAEPVWVQFIQQGIGDFVNRRLSGFFSVRDGQERNRAFALRADSETIDLSAASDYITVELLSLLSEDGGGGSFPDLPSWSQLMLTYRSKFCALPDQSLIELKSVANMGNGFCFSLLTLICIGACLLTAERVFGVRISTRSEALRLFENHFSVFGDDIVVSRDLAIQTRRTLELMGLRVNSSKSSFDGYLKETCGLFALKGSEIPNILRLRDINVNVNSVASLCLSQRRAYRLQYRRLAALLTDALYSSQFAPLIATTNDVADYGDSLVIYGERSRSVKLHRRWNRQLFDSYVVVNRIGYDSRDISAGDAVGSMYLWLNPCSHITCEPVGGARSVSTKLYSGAQNPRE